MPHMPHLWEYWKGKMTAYPIFTFIQGFVKFQIMDSDLDTDERWSFIAYFHICYFCLTSEVKVVNRKNDGIPYINIDAKFYYVSEDGSGDTDEKS